MRRPVGRWLGIFAAALAGLLAFLPAGPAKAQEPMVYFCYAPNPADGVTYMSDVHVAGPVGERARYGEEFAAFLRKKGKLPEGAIAYCQMGSRRMVGMDHAALHRQTCRECEGAERMVDIAWPRETGRISDILLTEVPPPARTLDPPVEVAGDEEARPTTSVFLRRDLVDAVVVSNTLDSGRIARQRTIDRGGTWEPYLLDSQCDGWWALAFVAGKGKPAYFLVSGETQANADRNAAERLERFRGQEGVRVGVLETFNGGGAPAVEMSLLDDVKAEIRRRETRDYLDPRPAPPGGDRGQCVTAIGLRG